MTPELSTIDRLLRDRQGFLASLDAPRDPAALARILLATIAVAAGVFGAAIGLHRGGLQVVYAAVKMPLAVLLTAALAAPAIAAITRVTSDHLDMSGDLLRVLGALAIGTLVIAGLTPLLLLGLAIDLSYHRLTLLVVGCCAVGGVTGLAFLLRGLRRRVGDRGVVLTAAAALLIFGLVGAQMSWTLRPWLVRPRSPEVTFLRDIEGSFLEAVVGTTRSANGHYERGYAPVPGELHRPWTGELGR